MLAEERFSRILSIIEAEGSATRRGGRILHSYASESTVRRDLITMDENGLLDQGTWRCNRQTAECDTHDVSAEFF